MTTPMMFTPFDLSGVTLPNRIVLSPMGQHMADDGAATDWHIMHLGQFAISGAGLVLTESVALDANSRISPGCLGLWDERTAEAMGRVARFVKQNSDARFGVQLNHAGRKASVLKRWERSKPLLVADGGWPVEGASAIGYPGRVQPTQMSLERLAEVKASFAHSAKLAAQSGSDVIEIHAAHGYLLHCFLSPLANNRDDAYGQSLENRMRFPLEVFEAVRAAAAPHMAVGVRVSATDWVDGGWTPAETVVFARELKARGCNYICASTGGLSPDQKIDAFPQYQVPFSEQIKREVDIATIAVGLITDPAEAEAVLQRGQADLIALGRGFLKEPRWPWRAAQALGATFSMPKQYV